VGNVAKQVDADGRTIVYDYDALNRKTREYWFQPQTGNVQQEFLWFGYDSSNRVTFEADFGKANYSYSYLDYDNGGRLVATDTVTGGAPRVDFAYQYNGDAFLTQTDAWIGTVTAAASGSGSSYANVGPGDYASLFPSAGGSGSSGSSPGFTADYTNVYTPDALERVHAITQTGPGVAPKSVKFDYDPQAGNLGQLTRYADAGLATPVLQTSDWFDNARRVSAITDSQIVGGQVLAPSVAYSWQYLAGTDRIQQFTSSADGTTAYGYDHQNQLVTATLTPPGMSPGEPTEAYGYDANGNPDQRQRVINVIWRAGHGASLAASQFKFSSRSSRPGRRRGARGCGRR
jgi:YD repeat-containing protein